MWLSQAAYLELIKHQQQLQAKYDAAVAFSQSRDTTISWLMTRLTQVEHERATLLFNYTGVRLASPVYEQQAPQEATKSGVDNPLNAIPNYNDVGDDEARRLGISWDTEGNISYGTGINNG